MAFLPHLWEGQAAFCVVIASVLHAVVHHPPMAEHRKRIKHWLYVDDWVAQLSLSITVAFLNLVVAVASEKDLPLQLPKCAFHVPALSGVPVADLPPDAIELSVRMRYCPVGLTLLGTEACGDLAVPLLELSLIHI